MTDALLSGGILLLTLALTSALLGITEPIEFLFAFTAPWLFLAHALLTGLSLAICSGPGRVARPWKPSSSVRSSAG